MKKNINKAQIGQLGEDVDFRKMLTQALTFQKNKKSSKDMHFRTENRIMSLN